ncbi:SDR family oxidoreductase [Nocardiopsis lambiniae]|uniref:SDR family oxidoreductase n=1 Tax=Nocardiopsis lambiniae TaxID=3075539 RepID=A0ABU2MA49_9ACTN|nr:SDR family oxidoreductase [Nocardiopsis sp. DSM 44743]MDT0329549.1 SDR family oxidoreductase [Nocardiopsis sp. DSM 44743]
MTNSAHLPLQGRTALVTGVSRRRGIGYAIAVRLAGLGADLFVHHHRAHDADQPWGADDLGPVRDGVRAALRPGAAFGDLGLDLAAPDAPERLITAARGLTGSLDVLVCNHARSGGDGSILDMTAERLDGHWSVNTRSTLLLTSHFARAFAGVREAPAARPGDRRAFSAPLDEHATGRVFWTTSGQIHGPMVGEVAYAASKAALAGLTPTVAAELLPHGIVLNTIDPGPVNTGYLDPESTDRAPETIARVRDATPFGRFGRPDDPARLVGWLATDEGRWIIGQVISTDGGFSLGTGG